MKRWGSAILALALLAMPAAALEKRVIHTEQIRFEESCCCHTTENVHSERADCPCEGCAQKNSAECYCVETSLSFTAFLQNADSSLLPAVCGTVLLEIRHGITRTDPPVLRPPIALS